MSRRRARGRSSRYFLPTWIAAGLLAAVLSAPSAASGPAPRARGGTPIDHVVIVYQENHSFNEVLGRLCLEDDRCDGTAEGVRSDGTRISLGRAEDFIPTMAHAYATQQQVINGGDMNGWDKIQNCKQFGGFKCYVTYYPDQIPALATLGRQFVISDRTFQMDTIPTWGAHLELVAQYLVGFHGDNPYAPDGSHAPAGCDSGKDADWQASPTDPFIPVPACVPKPDGSGPYRDSPVRWAPTIMNRMDEAGLPWKIYASQPGEGGYGYATCPTFAECIYGPQGVNHVDQGDFFTDAANGTLPNLAMVMPTRDNSQHNEESMLVGDNWIGSVVSAMMNSSLWNRTAIFITYDDCGCFYDHVVPPPGLGLRVPMVIVSPYSKPGYTDSQVASFASMFSFIERVLGLEPLWVTDGLAYDYWDSFDFTQRPHHPIRLDPEPIPSWMERWLAAHPSDPNDPT